MSELFSFLKSGSDKNQAIVKLFDKPAPAPRSPFLNQASDSEEEQVKEQTNKSISKVMSAKEEYEQNQRTIFIGNASKDTTKKDLKKHFKECGLITKIRIRSAPVSRETKGSVKAKVITKEFTEGKESFNLYAVFKDKESVEKALGLNGSELKGRHLRVDRGGGKAGGFKRQKKEDKPINDYETTLFLGNLPYKVDQEKLWQYFKECGKIENVRIIRDRETFLSRGIGYVQMGNKEEMRRAIEKARKQEFQNRWLRVKKAAPPQRVAKKIVKKEMALQERRDKKREEKWKDREFQNEKQQIRSGGQGGVMGLQFVNRVKMNKKKEKKIRKEMMEGKRSKTLEREHRRQFTGGDEKEQLKENRDKRKKENTLKSKRVEIKKH